MSAAVPSGRRITGGLLKGYFIRTSSSYPAYPREFPAGVRKSFRHSSSALSPSLTLPLSSSFSSKWFFCSAENSRRRRCKTRARGLFHSWTTRGKWERDTWKAVFTTRLTRGDGILRNGKIFSTSTNLYFFFLFFASGVRKERYFEARI